MKNSTLYTIILLITGISIFFIINAVNSMSKLSEQDPAEEDLGPSTSNEDSEEEDPATTIQQ